MSNKFILPHAAYPKLITIISAYYGVGRAISTTELSELSETSLSIPVLSGSTTFLALIGVLEVVGDNTYSNRPRRLTGLGRELGIALNAEPRSDTKISDCWAKIVKQNNFLSHVYEIVKARKSIGQITLQNIIIKRADRKLPDSHSAKIGSKTVVDILEKSRLIYRDKSKGKEGILRVSETSTSVDVPPDFSSLTSDVRMQNILENRWIETSNCVKKRIPLAAAIMMGALLEGLFYAKIEMEQDKSKVYKATNAPLDKKSGKVLTLDKWTLHNFISVAYELGWITQSVKQIGDVLKDHRNIIHPREEYDKKVVIINDDAEVLWDITMKISRDLVSK